MYGHLVGSQRVALAYYSNLMLFFKNSRGEKLPNALAKFDCNAFSGDS